MTDVTRILNAIEHGDAGATEKLLPLVYEELRILATQKMAHEKPGQTLQATALVHEAYLRLVEGEDQGWNNRGHFFAAAAEAMRRILVESARRKNTLKRGGDRQKSDLDEIVVSITGPSEDMLVLDEALERLSGEDQKAGEVVKLHYFAGLTLEQIAGIQKTSRRTVVKSLAYARAWLYREMGGDGEPGP